MEDQDNIPDLPTASVTKILENKDCPFVSINIPCYLRRKFVPLMLVNLVHMDYPPEKVEVNILQDGPEDLLPPADLKYFKETIAPMKLQYKYEPKVRRTIGEKRNLLVKSSSHKIIACMDSDDIYFPTYLRFSISAMKEFNAGITSSAQMMFIYPDLDWKITGIRCGYKHQGHEAVAVFTKKHWRSMGGFVGKGDHSNAGEGVKMIAHNEKNMVNLPINLLMCCVVHGGDEGNTISKDRFKDAVMGGEMTDLIHIEVLKEILSIEGN